jgi:RNA polymerase sigma factor (sigma-70 family)
VLPCDFPFHRVLDLSAILHRYERPLIAYAQHQGCDAETARDVTQETFLRLFKSPPADGDDVEAIAPLVFSICRNLTIDHYRKNHRLIPMDTTNSLADAPDESMPSPDTATTHNDDARVLRGLLASLPEREREIVRLKFEGGLSYRDIAAATGTSVSNVGYLLHHAIQNLRTQYQALA